MNTLSHSADAEMVMRIRLDPNGRHTLQVGFVGRANEFALSADQTVQLARGIERFRQECTIDDARLTDRTHQHFVAVEV